MCGISRYVETALPGNRFLSNVGYNSKWCRSTSPGELKIRLLVYVCQRVLQVPSFTLF
jgi:hypothetical protein